MRFQDLNLNLRNKIKECKYLLSKGYQEIINELNSKYPEATQRTKYEYSLEKDIQNHSNDSFVKSFWIGKYNCDFFFPYLSSSFRGSFICGESMRMFKGLVLEVDGGVHYEEFKM